MRKGQVTVYVFIGILVLFIVGSIMYAQQLRSGAGIAQGITYPPKVQEVRDLVEACVQKTVNEGLMVLGLQGGYYQLPERVSAETALTSFAYWYYNGQAVVPSLEEVEDQLSLYVRDNVPACAGVGEAVGLDIQAGRVAAEVMSQGDGVLVSVDYPLSMNVGGVTAQIRDPYMVGVPVRLQKVYESARQIVNNTVNDPEYVDITYLAASGFDIEVTPMENGGLLYAILDRNSVVNNMPFQFVIGVDV